ncbi:MAG: hypothetical protein JWM95_2539 [Gemmatimonadetes bacterium]|nr:hypothetical protein [Gemmatimonadota bacterium]
MDVSLRTERPTQTFPRLGYRSHTASRLAMLVMVSGLCGDVPVQAQCQPPCVEAVEVVASGVGVPGDTLAGAGDGWGGHQSRIVRMSSGEVFVSWLVPGRARNKAVWRVARRAGGQWDVVGTDMAGREPASLLRTPDDRLLVVAWPEGRPVLWTGVVQRHSVRWTREDIPGPWVTLDSYYGAAGISVGGRLCVLESADAAKGQSPAFIIACRNTSRTGTRTWASVRRDLPKRFAYAYVIPEDSALFWVANRDVLWTELGLQRPSARGGAYVYNSIRLWSDSARTDGSLIEQVIRGEEPSRRGDFVYAFARDFVKDGAAMHVIYNALGPDTRNGDYELRHAFIRSGRTLWDEPLPSPIATDDSFHRLILSGSHQLFWLFGMGSTVMIYPSQGEDGRYFEPGVRLDMRGHRVGYSGISVAAPRGGTPWSDRLDFVFPSEGKVIYARIRLAETSGATSHKE